MKAESQRPTLEGIFNVVSASFKNNMIDNYLLCPLQLYLFPGIKITLNLLLKQSNCL